MIEVQGNLKGGTLADQRGEAGFFRSHPRPAERFAYLQQLLQQEAHLPSEHFMQELQLVLQHFAQALSAAEAAASPRPAMMASMAPALISVFIVFFFVVVPGRDSFPPVLS